MPRESYVYVLERGKHVKVGFSDRPKTRLKEIQSHSVEEVLLAYEFGPFPSEKATVIERAAHSILKASRIRGEWFLATDTQAALAIRKALRAYDLGKIETILKPKKYNYNRLAFVADEETLTHIQTLRARFAVEGSKGYQLTSIVKRAIKKLAEETE